MKVIIGLIYLFIIINISAEEFPIMLNLKSEVNISSDFRDGIEEGVTSKGYSLIDEKAQKEALADSETNEECLDDSCLIDTGKMLAAKAIIIVEVEQKEEKNYKFKTRLFDFEKGTTTKTKVLYYKDSLQNFEQLSNFGKKLVIDLLDINKNIEESKKSDKIIIFDDSPRWELNLSIFAGTLNGEIESVNNELIKINDIGAGISLGMNYRFNNFFSLFSNLYFLKLNNAVMLNMSLDFGTKFKFDILYGKFGLNLGFSGVQFSENIKYIEFYNLVIEGGVNLNIFSNNFDIYISFSGGKYSNDNSNIRNDGNSYSSQLLLGIRYYFLRF